MLELTAVPIICGGPQTSLNTHPFNRRLTRISPSLSSTSYKNRTLPHHKSNEHKRKWPQNLQSLLSPTKTRWALIAEWNVSPRWTSNQPLRFRFINISANHSAVEAWLRLWLVLLSPQLKPVHLWEGKEWTISPLTGLKVNAFPLFHECA